MCEKKIIVILFHLTLLHLTNAYISLYANLPRCRYKCDNSKHEDIKGTKKIKDVYWRDYYGVIPPDAYQLGDDNQNPQTYVGIVFDPSNNGTFVTTIVEGQDYVYGVLDVKVSRRTEQIQILCTMESERLTWKELYNKDQMDGYAAIFGSFHTEKKSDSEYLGYVQHYVVKTSVDKVVYAGYSTHFNSSMTFALMDGTPKKAEKYEWLLFAQKPKDGNESEKSKSLFNINFNSRSFVPKFDFRIGLGSCSLVCTNREKDTRGKEKELDKRSENSMVYYWKPNKLEYTGDALKVGTSFSNRTLYIAQSYTYLNWYDVGLSDEEVVYISSFGFTDAQFRSFQILSSISQEKLEWVNSTTKTFGQLDKTKLIPGGHLDNGTETFVGRAYFVNGYKPGSIKVLPHGTYCTLLYGDFEEFQVLTIKDEKS